MKELYRRGVAGALALLLDMVMERVSTRWSPTATSVAGLALARLPRHMPGSVGLWAEAGLLSTTLGMRQMGAQSAARAQRLAEAEPGEDVTELAADALAELADDASDEVVAPLCCYLLGGLPGAMLYRLAVNMQESLGPQGAEIVRWLRVAPSRVTGALFVAAAYLRHENGSRAWRLWRRDGLSAPDAVRMGPRSALAGALGVQVSDEAKGSAGVGERPPVLADVGRATRLTRTAIALGAALMLSIPIVGRLRK